MCIAFEAVIGFLKCSRRVLCITHPSSVHRSLQCLTPLDALPSSQLEQLEFLYVNTSVECLEALASIGLSCDECIPEMLFVDIASLEDGCDLSNMLRVLALLDNTVRFVRASHSTDSFSITVIPFGCDLLALSSSLHTTLPIFAVPNPVIVVNPTSSDVISVSLIRGAVDNPKCGEGDEHLFDISLGNQGIAIHFR
jgi:hypothetical protein